MRPDRYEGLCVHCGGKLIGLGVIHTVNPRTGEPIGLAVCRPMGKKSSDAHMEPYDCWSLVKHRGYELGSFRRTLDLAMLIQSDLFEVELESALEEICRENAGTDQGGTSA